MKKFSLMLLVSILAVFIVSCASNEVKEPTDSSKVQEPQPSKKPKLDEAFKPRARDIK
ncbi:hypothetical protein P3G55_05795 [Leptospira sp. 96542]|nr:hypothetical protein [Leptospira sp. 96542]